MRKEKRKIIFKNLNIRSNEKEGKKYIEGIIPYDSPSVPIWGTTEIIGRDAFKKTLKDKAEVRALWNHNDSYVLGNTQSGTLEIEDSEKGLICRCELPHTSYADDLYEIITRGDVRTMSFGFSPIKWEDANNGKLRTLKEVKLEEVSYGVIYAAYPETNSQTYMRGFMKRKIDIERINEILEKEEINKEDLTALQEIVDNLTTIIKEHTPQSEEEAVRAEPPKTDTPPRIDTSTDEEKEDKELKSEIIAFIDMLFEIGKELYNERDESEETNE
jgi:HK97 family phage prohead protease